MTDLTIQLENRPGALARIGEVLGQAGVSIEGGFATVVNGAAIAHFLFQTGDAAATALRSAGITGLTQREVHTHRLDQALPGQLGAYTRKLANEGVNIETMYSDHDHRLILVFGDSGK